MKEKKSRRRYFLALAIYTMALVFAAAFAIATLWRYGQAYETGRVENAMDSFMERLPQLYETALKEKLSTTDHAFQTEDECMDVLKNAFLQGELGYQETMSDLSLNEENYRYQIICGDYYLGSVTFVEDKSVKSSFGMHPWKTQDVKFEFGKLTTSAEITVPASYSVCINGKTVGEEYIVDSGIEYDIYEGYYNSFEGIPTKVTYRCDNLVGIIPAEVFDEDGKPFVINPDAGDEQFVKKCEGEIIPRMQEFSDVFFTNYLSYVSGTGSAAYKYYNLLQYVKQDSEFASRLYQSLDGYSNFGNYTYYRVDNINFNYAIPLGTSAYIMDVSTASTATHRSGRVQDAHDSYKLVVIDDGTRFLAVSVDSY